MNRFGGLALAAATMCAALPAQAARYYEFELFGVAPVTYYDPFGVQQPVSFNRASRFTVSFDTATTDPILIARGVEEVATVFSPRTGSLQTLNMPGGVYFRFVIDLARVAEGPALMPLAVDGAYGYLNCANRYRVCTDIPVAQFTFAARTSDVAPAFLGERESALLTPVPEPAAWAMMIVGVGAVGGGLRRRPRVRAAVGYA